MIIKCIRGKLRFVSYISSPERNFMCLRHLKFVVHVASTSEGKFYCNMVQIAIHLFRQGKSRENSVSEISN